MALDLKQEAILELTELIVELQSLESAKNKIIEENDQIEAARSPYPKKKIRELDESLRLAKEYEDYDAVDQFEEEIKKINDEYKYIIPPPELYPKETSLVIDDFFYRIFGNDSNKYLEYAKLDSNLLRISFLRGILRLLKENRIPFREIVSAEIFSDFLDMAKHLLDESYKDAAAVIIGSVLEEHLRKLCIKTSIPLELSDVKGKMKPKKASTLNTDLVAAGVYGKSDQAYVEAWQKTRNDAAHGDYLKYTKEQVANLLQAVKDFITRLPA